jgi:hypothetical protein
VSALPQMYDVQTDEMRPVTQEDIDLAMECSEADYLRKNIIKSVLKLNRDRLRAVNSLLTESGLIVK